MNKIITTMDKVKEGNLDVRIDITEDKDELNYIEQLNLMICALI